MEGGSTDQQLDPQNLQLVLRRTRGLQDRKEGQAGLPVPYQATAVAAHIIYTIINLGNNYHGSICHFGGKGEEENYITFYYTVFGN